MTTPPRGSFGQAGERPRPSGAGAAPGGTLGWGVASAEVSSVLRLSITAHRCASVARGERSGPMQGEIPHRGESPLFACVVRFENLRGAEDNPAPTTDRPRGQEIDERLWRSVHAIGCAHPRSRGRRSPRGYPSYDPRYHRRSAMVRQRTQPHGCSRRRNHPDLRRGHRRRGRPDHRCRREERLLDGRGHQEGLHPEGRPREGCPERPRDPRHRRPPHEGIQIDRIPSSRTLPTASRSARIRTAARTAVRSARRR